MIHYVEFLMPMFITDEELMIAKKNRGLNDIHIEVLPGDRLKKKGMNWVTPFAKPNEQLRILKVSVLTPCLLHGDPVKFLEPKGMLQDYPRTEK